MLDPVVSVVLAEAGLQLPVLAEEPLELPCQDDHLRYWFKGE